MWPFPKQVRRWFREAMQRIEAEGASRGADGQANG
jgi:hypothetical protein